MMIYGQLFQINCIRAENAADCKRYLIRTLLVFQLAIHSLNGKCFFDTIQKYHDSAECISMDEEQLLTFIQNSSCDLTSLKIENSFIPQIEIFPTRCTNLNSLSMTNSRIRSILSANEGLGGYTYLSKLDLSFNDIKEINFIGGIYRLKEIVISHNQIEFLNGSDLANIYLENLDLSYNNIKNFTKLQSGNLISLNLSHNSLESIGDLLTDLRRIENIDFSYNKLKNIFVADLKNLHNIKSLNLKHNDILSLQCSTSPKPPGVWDSNINGIVDLSFNHLTLLSDEIFSCWYVASMNFENNGLEDLNFLMSHQSGNSLTLRRNKIKTLYPLNFKGSKLLKLDLSFNEIELVPTSAFEGSSLRELSLDHNKITSLNSSSFSGLRYLSRLNLSFNPLTTIDGSVFSDLRLESLDLSHCLLSEVPRDLSKIKSLSKIYLSHNNIKSIEPESFPSLATLDLSFNKIKKLDANVFSGLSISNLNLSYNNLGSLKNVFNNTKISNVTLTGISLSKLSEKDVEGLNELEYLDLGNAGIEELTNNTFDRLTSLKTLFLDNNSIRMIPSNIFDFNANLQSLSIIQNPISIIPLDAFSHKMKLKYLNLTIDGKISKKRFFNLIFLEELHILHSSVTEIHKYSFKGLVSLRKLNFENSTVLKVEPGAFSGLRNVLDFDAQNLFANIGALRSKTFVGLETLQSLNLSKIGIRSIEDGAFFGLDGLVNLTLDHNKIGKLPKNAFTGLKTLRMLDLSHNNLAGKESTFPIGTFRDLIELTDLHLQHNRIVRFHIGEFSNLGNLKFLNLSHNQLSYLDRHLLFPLKKLEVLDINSNHVIKFDYQFTFKHLPSLKTMGIGENKWPCENMTIMLNNFEEHAVDYRQISKLEFEVENIGGIYCVNVCNYLYCPTEEDLLSV